MRLRDGVPALVLAAVACAATAWVPTWLGPWLVAGALFHGCKWAAWRGALRDGLPRSRARAVAWFLLWPGLDARAFFDPTRRPARPAPSEWAAAFAKTAVGAGIVFGLARLAPEDAPLLRGWIGLFGASWLLLFGLIHVLSCAGRALGVDTRPLWRSPALATSVGDFWSNRWNLAFRDFARQAIHRPVRRRLGGVGSLLVVFVASGVAHDLVFSVPVRSGLGLCTLYFLLQAGAVLLERSPLGRRLRLRHGLRGRLFALLVTGPPSFFLFHPAFVTRAWVPFLGAVGAA